MYSARRAWLLAYTWFAFCATLVYKSGLFSRLSKDMWGPYRQQQLHSHMFWASCIAMFAFGTYAYAVLWRKGTRTFDRPLFWPAVIFIGLPWGASLGLMKLVYWHLSIGWFTGISQSSWVHVLIALLLDIIVSPIWQTQFWDKFVSPDHNIEEWNMFKIKYCHTPTLMLTLLHFWVFQCYWMVVAEMVWVIMVATWAMHFPSPSYAKPAGMLLIK